jgi:hypothetical protein
VIKDAERLISIFANTISILTFFLAVFGLVNFDIIPNFRTNNQNATLLIVGLLSLAISYAGASIIRERIEENQQYGGLVVIFCALYIFMTSFLIMQFVDESAINFDKNFSAKLTLVSGLLYVFINFGVYLAKLSWPNGLTILHLFIGAFTKGYWIMMGHIFVYLMLMLLLYPMFIDAFA